MWVIHSRPWYWLVWPWWGGRMYQIVTGVTSDVGVPSTYLVTDTLQTSGFHCANYTELRWAEMAVYLPLGLTALLLLTLGISWLVWLLCQLMWYFQQIGTREGSKEGRPLIFWKELSAAGMCIHVLCYGIVIFNQFEVALIIWIFFKGQFCLVPCRNHLLPMQQYVWMLQHSLWH